MLLKYKGFIQRFCFHESKPIVPAIKSLLNQVIGVKWQYEAELGWFRGSKDKKGFKEGQHAQEIETAKHGF